MTPHQTLLREHIQGDHTAPGWLDRLRELSDLAFEQSKPKLHVFPLLFTPEMIAAAERWLKHRSEIRHPLKATSQEAFFRKCIEWGDARAIAAIEYSIEQGYQGMIEPKRTTYGQPATPTADAYAERQRQIVEANAQHYQRQHSAGH